MRTNIKSPETFIAYLHYVLAVLIFLLALLIRFWFAPVESGYPYLTFYPAMVITFYFCGLRAGTVFVLLSTATAYYIFIPPFWNFSANTEGNIATAIYMLSATFIGLIINQLRNIAISNEKILLDLRGGEQRYKDFLDDQTDLICRYQVDGTLLYVNEAFCHYFGKSSAELIGQKWHPIAYEEDVVMIDSKLKLLSVSNPVVSIENRVVNASKEIRWGQFFNKGFFDKDGQLIEVQAVGRDITEQKFIEKK